MTAKCITCGIEAKVIFKGKDNAFYCTECNNELYAHEISELCNPCENDKECIKMILANNKPQHVFHDITTRHPERTPAVDLYIAGFPCQPFSNAGKRLGFQDNRQGNLFFAIKDIVEAKRPKIVFLENLKLFLQTLMMKIKVGNLLGKF